VLADQLVLDADGDVHEGEGVQLGQHHVEPLHHLLAIKNKNSIAYKNLLQELQRLVGHETPKYQYMATRVAEDGS
jgi:hypothetical protein